jgi:uncharacterized protein (DUF433 family)
MEHSAQKVWKDLIWQDEDRMSGAPCIYGTRIRVQDLFDWLAGGGSVDEFLLTYPIVPRERVVAIIKLAERDLLKEFDVA